MNKDVVLQKVKNEVEAMASRSIDDPDTEIFTSGILDSLNILNILTFLESEFQLQINPFDINLDTMGTINNICDYIISKKRC